MTPDGREWVFVHAAGAVAKNLIAIPNTVTTATTVSSSTDNQGRIVYLTDTDSTFTTGAFQDGIGVVYTGTGAGQTFKIKTNSPTVLTLYPETALTTALSVSDSGLKIQTMSNVLIAAVTSKVQMTVGSPQVSFALDDYGWMLTEGDGGVICSNTLVVGSGFTSGGSTAGEVLVAVTATGPYDAQNLGYCIVANGSEVSTLVRFLIRG